MNNEDLTGVDARDYPADTCPQTGRKSFDMDAFNVSTSGEDWRCFSSEGAWREWMSDRNREVAE